MSALESAPARSQYTIPAYRFSNSPAMVAPVLAVKQTRSHWDVMCCRVMLYDQLKFIEAAAVQYSDILTGRSTAPDDQAWSKLSRNYEALQQQQQVQQQQEQEGRLNKLIQDLLASMATSQVRAVRCQPANDGLIHASLCNMEAAEL